MSLNHIFRKISAFFKTKRGKDILKWGQRFVNVAVLIWLIFQLSNIGWIQVWQSLPVVPIFYFLFILTFLQLPLFEILIYRISWSFNALESIPIFLLKRFYNKDVMGYSGELYFFTWARETLPKNGTEVFKIIKDNNIISSVASTFISLGLLAAFLLTDQIKIVEWIANQNQAYFMGGVLLVAVIIFLFIKFRHYVISMSLKTAYKIFGIQVFRLLLAQFINLLMYYVILPDIPLYIWFTFIAVDIILSRIPFLPNRDLIFAGMSIGLAGNMAVPQEAIAGIVLTKSVLNKIGGAASFGLAHFFMQKGNVSIPEEEEINRYTELQNKAESDTK